MSQKMYAAISRDVWLWPEFEALSDDAKLVFFHACTTPYGNTTGLYQLRKATAADELNWPLERYEKAFAELFEDCSPNSSANSSANYFFDVSKPLFGLYDTETKTIFLPHFLDVHFARNPNVIKAWGDLAARIPGSEIKTLWIGCVAVTISDRGLSEGFQEQFIKQFGEQLPEQFGKPFSKQFLKLFPHREERREKRDIINSLRSLIITASEIECSSPVAEPAPPPPPAEQKPIASVTTITTSSKSKKEALFDQFWDVFAYKQGRKEALTTWLKIPDLFNQFDRIMSGAAKEAQLRGIEDKTPKMAQGWLSSERWNDDFEQRYRNAISKQHGGSLGVAEQIRAANQGVIGGDAGGYIDAEYTTGAE